MILNTTYITKLFTVKTPMIILSLLSSFSVGGLINIVTKHIAANNLQMTLIVLVAVSFVSGLFIFADFILGCLIARKKGDRVVSKKWGATVGKYFALVLYLVMAVGLVLILPTNMLLSGLVLFPLFLNILREYLSIGENIETLTGTRPYLFNLLNKVFVMIEKHFLNKIKNITNTEDHEEGIK